jgi:hypothetical protein
MERLERLELALSDNCLNGAKRLNGLNVLNPAKQRKLERLERLELDFSDDGLNGAKRLNALNALNELHLTIACCLSPRAYLSTSYAGPTREARRGTLF